MARKMAERKRKKETGELPADAMSLLLVQFSGLLDVEG
jgi:hypothetical protein